jgi:hypothetical protein
MSRAATFIALSITLTLVAYGCGSSSSDGTGGATGSGGANGTGGSTGTGGATGSGGANGTGGSTSNGGTTGTGGSNGTGGTTGAGGSLAACGDNTDPSQGESCNTIVPTGPCATETSSSATAPTPAGGTIVAGTYDLTTMTVYGAPPDSGLDSAKRGVIMISVGTGANTFNIQVAEQSGTTLQRQSGVAVANSAQQQITFTPSCPNGNNGGPSPYSATSTTFTLFEDQNGGTRVNIYTKR